MDYVDWVPWEGEKKAIKGTVNRRKQNARSPSQCFLISHLALKSFIISTDLFQITMDLTFCQIL